jgi:predicted DNA-binding transcriptional regulator AlpA
MKSPEESTVLSSWKDIALYLGKGVRTVQRWERQLGLPVRRPLGASQKSAVLLYRSDVDAWLGTRFSARPLQNNETALANSGLARSTLRERIRQARELRTTQQVLTEQIQESIRQLTERCDLLTTQTRQKPWFPASSVTPQLLPNTLANSGSLAPERAPEPSAG